MEFTYLDDLDRYYSGQMSSTERAMFEERLDKDPGLRKEYDAFDLLIQGITLDGEQGVRKQITDISKKLENEQFFDEIKPKPQNPMSIRKNAPKWGMLAAAVIVLAIAAVYFFMPQGKEVVSPQDAYAKYHQPESKVLAGVLDEFESAGMADPNKMAIDSLVLGLQAFENHEYELAANQFKAYLANHPGDQLALMYLGLSNLEMGKYAVAVNQLSPLAIDDNFEHRHTVRWYLALGLTQLEGGDFRSQAKGWFNKLANDPESGYSQEAEAMIELLKL